MNEVYPILVMFAGERQVVGWFAGDSVGNSTSQQVATGSGASNQINSAQVNRSASTAIHPADSNVAVAFLPWWQAAPPSPLDR
ncbi:hypothetical protein ACFY7H_03745 [Streptomyces sp. NPDC012794]|uniref:hypothetical protein n=1 Tax=Streptomyces sp. NPDC012794 TaxID=3364850 RepID=UPI003686AF44